MGLSAVLLGQGRLGDYAGVISPEALAELRRLAEPLAGVRVLHLSAGPFGGVVAETLAALVPLQRDLGLLADWQRVRSDAPRLEAALYAGLRGDPVRWGREERAGWQTATERDAVVANAAGYDVAVVHDPQALPLASPRLGPVPRAHWVWHCHLDITRAQADVWADVRRTLYRYDVVLFPSKALIRGDLPVPHVGIARPALDPCAPRNQPLAPEAVVRVLRQLGIDPERPLIGQFAPLEDRYAPLAALGTYWIARRAVPDLQIVLAEPSPLPGERPRRPLDQIAEAVGSDPSVHVLPGELGLGATELNALQRSVAVALQMAVPCGFSSGVFDAQWKGKPAVVGRAGQLLEQVGYGDDGFVVDGAPDAADAVVRLLRDPCLARGVGQRGRARVMRRHTITRLAAESLQMLQQVLAGVPQLGGAA